MVKLVVVQIIDPGFHVRQLYANKCDPSGASQRGKAFQNEHLAAINRWRSRHSVDQISSRAVLFRSLKASSSVSIRAVTAKSLFVDDRGSTNIFSFRCPATMARLESWDDAILEERGALRRSLHHIHTTS